jgi:hypothetical protein
MGIVLNVGDNLEQALEESTLEIQAATTIDKSSYSSSQVVSILALV